jgi:hypothetical protein
LKVDQQSESQAPSFEVVDALSHMLVREAIHAFQFNDNPVFDHQISAILTYAEQRFTRSGSGSAGKGWLRGRF